MRKQSRRAGATAARRALAWQRLAASRGSSSGGSPCLPAQQPAGWTTGSGPRQRCGAGEQGFARRARRRPKRPAPAAGWRAAAWLAGCSQALDGRGESVWSGGSNALFCARAASGLAARSVGGGRRGAHEGGQPRRPHSQSTAAACHHSQQPSSQHTQHSQASEPASASPAPLPPTLARQVRREAPGRAAEASRPAPGAAEGAPAAHGPLAAHRRRRSAAATDDWASRLARP